MRFQRRAILPGVARPHRDAAKPETTQQVADRALRQAEAPRLLDLAGQIDTPPANHPVFGELRTGPHPSRHHRRLLRVELWRRTRCPLVGQAGKSHRVVAMHPIAQALPVHPAARCGLLPRAPVKHQRQRQHPTRRGRVPAVSRRPPKPGRVQLPTGDLNRFRHPIPHIFSTRDRIVQNLV